jgi:hypothetical protein
MMFYQNRQKRNLKEKIQDQHIQHFQEITQVLIIIADLIITIIAAIIIIIIVEKVKIKEGNSNLNQKENIIKEI